MKKKNFRTTLIAGAVVLLAVNVNAAVSSRQMNLNTDEGEATKNRAQVYLENELAEKGDTVVLFRQVCQNPSGKGPAGTGCTKVHVGKAVVVEKLNNRKALVEASPHTKLTKDLTAEIIDSDAISGIKKE